jgi:hypothetical protein
MTLATVGQAAGVGAALCESEAVTPPDIASDHVDTLQQRLLRDDQWVIGVPNRDPDDLARDASVTASSSHPATVTDRDRRVPLDKRHGIHVASEGHLESLALLLDTVDDGGSASLHVEIYDEGRPENYEPDDLIGRETVTVDGEEPSWVDVPVGEAPDGQGVFVILPENPDVAVLGADRTLSGIMALPDTGDWGRVTHHARPPAEWVPCIEVDGEDEYFEPEAVVDGFSRPFGRGHSWISAPSGGDGTPDDSAGGEDSDETGLLEEEWIELSWDEPQTLATVQLTTNTRLTKWYNIFGREDQAEPETIEDYRIEVPDGDGGWQPVVEETGNYQRRRRHTFDPVETDRVRVVCEDTHGVDWAELYEVRAYGPDTDVPLGER